MLPMASKTPREGKYAKQLSALELMARPLSEDLESIPTLMNQSWSPNELACKLKDWSDSFRNQLPDQEWVLWTDDDNLTLVKTYFPAVGQVGRQLQGIDHLSLHDLDLENADKVVKWSGGLLGRMGTDLGFEHSILNACMAAAPGYHPFLLLLESVHRAVSDGAARGLTPEALTGPIALINEITRQEHKDNIDDLIARISANPLAVFYGPLQGVQHAVEFLPVQYIYHIRGSEMGTDTEISLRPRR